MTRKFSGTELVVATHNKGKLREFQEMFGQRPFKIFCAADFNLESPAETGTTFIENALLKAKFVAQATGKVALADDSGLCVDALQGAPGVYSADWADLPDGGRDFNMAIRKVHEALAGSTNRKAHFVSVIALCWPDGHCETVEGGVHGHLVWPPRGTQGHGYDPIFVPDGHDITFGEMNMAEKNAMSHRADAFRKIIDKCFR